MNSSAYRGVKLLKLDMTVVETLLERNCVRWLQLANCYLALSF